MTALASPLAARSDRSARAGRVGNVRALARYFMDREASIFGKAFVLFTVAYIAMPIDLIPDVAPVIGWLDDLGMATIALMFLSRVLKRYR